MNELEEIKSRTDIVELIGGYVQLKKAGRNHKGLCPFHSEKTPSFMVSPEKQIWHCFGACSEGGDVFSFLQKMEGLSFGEAVQNLAEKSGVKLERRSYEKDAAKKSLYSVNQLAADYYAAALKGREGRPAWEYLTKKRRLTDKTVQSFQLGYAPRGRDGLQKELRKHKITSEEMRKAGLVKDREGRLNDFFWQRLMFPIKNAGDQVIGFSARVLDDSLPKYINTPETAVYSKSNILYGIDLAKDAFRKQDHAILVEGMMDVIASHQAGVRNVVATGGTALTENQLRLISRFTRNIKLAFDIDFAGNEATRRAIELAWKMDFNIKVILLPEGKDPGDIAVPRPDDWKEAAQKAQYVIDYLFDESLKKHNKKDALGRKYIAKELLPVIRRIDDEIERDSYIKRLSNELLVDESSVAAALRNISLPKTERIHPEEKKEEAPADRAVELEKNLLGLLSLLPNYLDFAASVLKPSDFTDKECGNLFKKMLKYYNDKNEFSESGFLSSLGKKESEAFKHYVLSAEANFSDLDEEKKAEEVYLGAKRIKKRSLVRKKMALSLKIEDLERKKDREGAAKALKNLSDVLSEEHKIN